MEVKGILDKIRQQEKEKKEYLFALQLDEGVVKCAIWTIENGTVKVVSIGETQYWENEKEILTAVDASISSATEKASDLEKDAEPNKVILGVAPDWVEDNKIIADRLEVFKKISKELDLSPTGFVVTPEAVIHFLKVNDGIPPTAILVGGGKKRLIITPTRLGKIIGNQIVNRSGDLGADVAEGLSRFSQEETFPPRIILYNNFGKDLDEEKQQLMNYPWADNHISFLHLPKVETLSPDFDIKAIALAGGREMVGAEKIVMDVEEASSKPDIEEEFVKKEEETELMGFVKGKDVAQELPAVEAVVPAVSEALKPKPKKLLLPKISISSIFNFFSKVKLVPRINLKFPSLKGLSWGKTPLIVGTAFAFIIVVVGVISFLLWKLPKADVILFVKPQVSQEEYTVKLDPNLNQVDPENLALPAKQVEAELEGEKTLATTGTKMVGEKSKGKVIIYNRTSAEKTLNPGTEITGLNGLKFSLNDKVTIASESAGSDYTRVPGKAEAEVTALIIGTESNLASGAEFTVANFSKSDYVAKNEDVFAGGTSREVQVVAKKDQEKLLKELTDELKSKALGWLSDKVAPGEKLVDESLNFKIVDKKFNKNVDEEADELKLNLNIKFLALAFNQEELKKLIEEKVAGSVPEGFEYKSEDSEISFSLKDVTKEGAAIFIARFKANLYPKLDLEAIRNGLAGKQPDIGRNYLQMVANIDSFETKIYLHLPDKIVTFPRNAGNIKIEVRKLD